MKITRAVYEITDPDAQLYHSESENNWRMEYYDCRLAEYLPTRPYETEADLIAAAAPPGESEGRQFMQAYDDVHFGEAHEDSCGLCRMHGEYTVDYFKERNSYLEEQMRQAKVCWQPDLRF